MQLWHEKYKHITLKPLSVGEITGNFFPLTPLAKKEFLNKISWRAHEFSISRGIFVADCQVIERGQLIESRQLRHIGAALLAEK